MEITEYPQDAPTVKTHRGLKITLASIAGAVLIIGGTWGGVAYANGITAERAHIAAVALAKDVKAGMPQLIANTAQAGDEADTSTADQVVAAEAAREAAVAAVEAADAAAAQAAANAASRNTARQSNPSGLPAGAVVPNIPGTTSPDTTKCASGSASDNSDGVAVCD